MTSSLFVSRLAPAALDRYPRGVTVMSPIPFAPFSHLSMMVRLTGLLPDDVFVITTVDERVDFPVSGVTEQNSAFDTFAEEKL
jgi:hypothetical protein